MNKILSRVSASLKAHAAGLGAAMTLLIADLNRGVALHATDWYAVAGAYLGVAAVTYVVPNAPPSLVSAAPVAAPKPVAQDSAAS